MQGYINDTLSTAMVTHAAVRMDFIPDQMVTENGSNVTQCRYKQTLLSVSLNKPDLTEHVYALCFQL